MQHLKRGERDLHLFAMKDEFATGANHVIEVVHRLLQGKKKPRGKLPPILFIQLDNCTRENKNRFIFHTLSFWPQMEFSRKFRCLSCRSGTLMPI